MKDRIRNVALGVHDIRSALLSPRFIRSWERKHAGLNSDDRGVVTRTAEHIYPGAQLSLVELALGWHGAAFRVELPNGSERVLKPQYSTEAPSINFWYPPTGEGKEALEHDIAAIREEAKARGLNHLVPDTQVYLIEKPLGENSQRREQRRGRFAKGKDVLVLDQEFVQQVALKELTTEEIKTLREEYGHFLALAQDMYEKHGLLLDFFGKDNLVPARVGAEVHWVLIDVAPVPSSALPGTKLLVKTWSLFRAAKAGWDLEQPNRRKERVVSLDTHQRQIRRAA